MSNLWFTADTHFGHENIIKYCQRPFKDAKHMNEVLVRNWNERVKDEDTVIFLGDFCFRNTPGGKEGEGETNKASFYLNQLNGQKVLVQGNHDRNNTLNTKITALEIEYGGQLIYCVHNPVDFDSKYSINLCAHVHKNWEMKKWGSSYLVNVGVDVWDYRPISFEEIQKRIKLYKEAKA